MNFFSGTTQFDFLGIRVPMGILFAVLTIVSILSLATRWLNLGLDFTGGTIVELGFEKPAELDAIRDILAKAGYSGAMVQYFGTQHEVLLRFALRGGQTDVELSGDVLTALRASISGGVEMRRVEYVGGQIGAELAEQGGLAMLAAMFGILIYVWLRFEWRLALSAVLTTLHDTI